MRQKIQARWLAIIAALTGFVFGDTILASPDAEALIARAGKVLDEGERQSALEALAADPGAAESLRGEARMLADFVRRWNGSSLKFYTEDLRGKPRHAIGAYDFGVAEESPLRPVAELYRGRMLAWTLIENSTVRTDPKDGKWFKDEAVAAFRRVVEAFPENTTARMYLGEALPWGAIPQTVDGAPEWATLQREQLERLGEILHWWIAHRQREGGEFGGGWGDDCEMWRWWASVLLGFEDPEIVAAQLRFSRAALARPHLKGGFNNRVTDVEHAAEDTTDNLVPLLMLEPENQDWIRWSRRLVDFLNKVWTGRNERGRVQFKSFHFSGSEVAPQPERAFDVIANVGALHPALLVWQRNGDGEIGRSICAWLDTWVEATAREENGKPAGILPASIRWPDGAVGGAGGNWWEPVKPGGFMHSYYVWPSVITEMTDALLLAHVMTGNESYLAPLRSMAAIRWKHLEDPPAEAPSPGGEAWCAEQLAPRRNANSNTGALVKSLARYRTLTGSGEFDALIAREGGEFVVRADEAGRHELVAALRESLGALRVNFPGFTSEVRSTDRCMRFVQFLAEDYAFDEYKGVTQPKHELLYRMVSGDQNAPRFPQPAVRWLTPPRDIAALVIEAGTTQFAAELFHFGAEVRAMEALFWQIAPGDYHWRLELTGEAGAEETGTLRVKAGEIPKLAFALPSRKTAILRIEKAVF